MVCGEIIDFNNQEILRVAHDDLDGQHVDCECPLRLCSGRQTKYQMQITTSLMLLAMTAKRPNRRLYNHPIAPKKSFCAINLSIRNKFIILSICDPKFLFRKNLHPQEIIDIFVPLITLEIDPINGKNFVIFYSVNHYFQPQGGVFYTVNQAVSSSCEHNLILPNTPQPATTSQRALLFASIAFTHNTTHP